MSRDEFHIQVALGLIRVYDYDVCRKFDGRSKTFRIYGRTWDFRMKVLRARIRLWDEEFAKGNYMISFRGGPYGA